MHSLDFNLSLILFAHPPTVSDSEKSAPREDQVRDSILFGGEDNKSNGMY